MTKDSLNLEGSGMYDYNTSTMILVQGKKKLLIFKYSQLRHPQILSPFYYICCLCTYRKENWRASSHELFKTSVLYKKCCFLLGLARFFFFKIIQILTRETLYGETWQYINVAICVHHLLAIPTINKLYVIWM